MSSAETVENIENAVGEQPSNLACQNSDVVEKESTAEDDLVDQVDKLDIAPNNVGLVVQHKLSESLSYLQNYNSDESSEESSGETSDAGSETMFHMIDVEESEDSEEVYEVMGETRPKGATRKQDNSTDMFGVTVEELPLFEPPQKVPDISTLTLSENEEFIHVGNINVILDKIVTIESLPKMSSYSLDTLFFLDNGREVLGYVYDVMGPVHSPMYVVNLESKEKIQQLGLQKGTKVYCAPKSQYTKYVFVHELTKNKGSDASWIGDVEVPPEFEEFSDDEEERRKRAEKTKSKRKRGSLERHQKFEVKMNRINEIHSKIYNVMDSYFTQQQQQYHQRQQAPVLAQVPPCIPPGHYVETVLAGTSSVPYHQLRPVSADFISGFDASIPPPSIYNPTLPYGVTTSTDVVDGGGNNWQQPGPSNAT